MNRPYCMIGLVRNLLGAHPRIQIVCEMFYIGRCSSGGNRGVLMLVP